MHEAYMTELIRKHKGKPLRDAMQRSGLSQADIAARTREVDVSGRGVSLGTVAKVTGRGKTAAETCRLRTAWLVATALGEPLQDAFDMPSVSTNTVERCNPHGDSDSR